jgi:PAS domain S-box-containing protein
MMNSHMLESSAEQLQKKPVSPKPETLIRVLHVDDDADFLKCSKQILEIHNPFQIETALSVNEALQKTGQKPYDVIVADYRMPERNGLDLLKELRDKGNDVPFILFTGKGREEVAIKALNLGANQYINKIGKPEAVYSELAHGIRRVVKGKKAEEELRESEEKFRNLAEKSPNMIFINKKGRVVYANKRCEDIMGYRREEFYSPDFNFFTLIAPESIELLKSSYSRHLKGEDVLPYEYTLITKEGKKIEAILTSKMITYEGEKAILGIVTDITERKKAEEKLRKSEEKYRSIVELSPDGIATMNMKGIITSVNKAFLDLTGFSKDEIVGKHFTKLGTIQARDLPKYIKLIGSMFRGKQLENFEFVYLRKDRTQRSGEARIGLMKEKGKTVGVQAILRDITDRKKVEEVLRRSEEKFRNIFEGASDLMICIDRSGRIFDVNRKAVEAFGGTKKELLGKHFTKAGVFSPKDIPKLVNAFSKGLAGKKSTLDLHITNKKGQEIHLDCLGSPMKKDNFSALLVVARDITERKLTQQALKVSEEKYHKQFEEALDAIFLADAETGILLDCNRAATKLLGRKKSELIGKHQRILHPPETIEGEFSRTFKQHLKEREGQILEAQVITKSGEIRDVAIKANVFEVGDKRIIQGTFRDITERKKAEKTLWESEEKYRGLLNGMNDTAWVIDSDCSFIEVNDAAVKALGYSRKELLSMKIFDIDFTLDPKKIKNLVNDMPKDEVQVFETAHTTKNGKTILVEISSSLVTYKGKQVILSIARDITERKKAQEELRQSNKRYRTVFENTGTAMCILEDDKTISMVNRRFEELSGYSWKELKGKKWTEFVTKEYLERMKRYHEARRKKGGKAPMHYFFDFVNRKRQVRNCMLTINMIPETKKSVASILDITNSKKAEKALLEADKKYRKTILSANVGIISYSPEGKVKILNPKMEQMTGFKRSEIRTLHHWFEKLYPNKEERQKIRDRWLKRMSEEGEVREGHAIITTKDGKHRNFLFNAVRLESGDSIAFAEDITERKEAEKKLDEMMNELVAINEKLGVVGRLTRHDARNKLSIIANNIYLAKQKIAPNNDALEFLGDVESAIDQMEKIFDFARNYEMLGVEELVYMDVGKSVEEAAILLSGMNGVKLVNECKGLMVMADSLLRQLFYNLIDDTLKYGEKVSQIRVHYEEGMDQLKLIYEDDGVGIPENEKELIFKEGYGKGTGYGLYLIKKMCEEYGWIIRETGKEGRGVQFAMTIPKTNKNGNLSYRFDTE